LVAKAVFFLASADSGHVTNKVDANAPTTGSVTALVILHGSFMASVSEGDGV